MPMSIFYNSVVQKRKVRKQAKDKGAFDVKTDYTDRGSSINDFTFQSISEEEMEVFKKELKRKKRIYNFKIFLLTIIMLVVFASLFFFVRSIFTNF